MLRKLLFALLFIVTVSTNNSAIASHIPGANITYTCDPNDPLTYTFTLTLFRVCPGTHPATMSASYFTLTNTCGLANPTVPTFNQVGVAEYVNQLCANATSDCSGGTSPGLWKYTYQATITLPADCDSWNIGFDLCCRDASSNLTGTTGNNMATNTTLNTVTAPCNDSPVVTSVPMPYACAGTQFNYCLTIADPEGDSTTFTMIAPLGAGQNPITHLAGFSPTAPLNNFTLNPQTGCISFNHPNTGNYVVTIQINSFDSNGNLIATVVHDFQVIVMSCTNTPPINPTGGISNFSGDGTQLDPNTISACYGDNVCFDVVFQDLANVGDVITIQQDGTTLLPGATFVQTGTNPATGTFCWTVQPGYTGSVVTFVAEDDGCPVMGTSGFAVDFNIQTGVYAGPDPFICGTQSTNLQAAGASAFTWSPATGLSCTNCANPVANPAVTTTYTVTGNLVGSCPNTDQVTVNVVPDFALSVVPATATICANEVIQLNAGGPAANGPYNVVWSPTDYLSDPNIANPLAQPLTSITYTSTVTSADGCTKTGDAVITVSGYGPTVSISPSDTTICPYESINLQSEATLIPPLCTISSGCSGTSSIAEVGMNTLTSAFYDVFYGATSTATNYTNKVQYIYTAQELNALGYTGGTIRSLALRFSTATTYTYNNVNIWIGCTSEEEFTSTSFIPTGTLTHVFGNVNNLNPTNNNWHTFDIVDYDWDGVSNIIIQFCSSENAAGTSGSESVYYTTTTPFNRCLYDHTTVAAAPACDELTGTRVTNRPNMRFDICNETLSSPTYSWTPSGTLSASNIPDPVASPAGNTSYVLNVTANGCTGSAIMNVTVDSPNDVTAAPDTMICPGDTYDLNAIFTGPTPIQTNPCGVGGPCTTSQTQYLIGVTTGTNTSTGWPTPFGNWYRNAKQQYLFTAAELNAMGLTGGTLNAISWSLNVINGTSVYYNYEIAIGCTNSTSLTTWETGLTTVFNPKTVNINTGWNNLFFDTNYEWDGVSNIVVQICYDNLAYAYTSNSICPYYNTGFNSTLYYISDATLACPQTTFTTSQFRPVTRFRACNPPQPAGATYTWTPPLDLSDPTIANPTVTPTAPGTTVSYAVEVTGGQCTVFDTVNIQICDPLPIELVSFTGFNKDWVNELQWTTSSETNNDYFAVQRSADGIHFEEIKRVKGQGTTLDPTNYHLIDETPILGMNYYRLRQTDFDGRYAYSNVIAINTNGSGIQIYPNPTTSDLFIDINESVSEGRHTIVITDLVGKVVREQVEFSKEQSTYKIENFKSLIPGMYMIQVIDAQNEVVKNQKIIKQ